MNTPIAPDLRSELFAAQDWYADLVAAVGPAQLRDPTPCTDYDVRRLLTHVSTVFDKVTGFAAEHRDPYADQDRSPEALTAASERLARERIDERTAPEQADALRSKTKEAREAWQENVLDTPIQLGWGPLVPGRVVTGIYLMEVLAHAWDLATATGRPSEAPDGLGVAGLAAARAGLPADRTGFPFGPAVEPAADAGPTEQLANWTGRRSR